MSGDTSIEWTDSTWNPVRGCTRVSPGCQKCYAERVAARFSGPGLAYEGLARRAANGEARWTGKVELVEKHLLDPLSWRKPRKIFVNSMSDLFHEDVPEDWIDTIFAVMALAPRHTFQILTKRPERMQKYLSGPQLRQHVAAACPRGWSLSYEGRILADWPLPNVWLGVSVEDQKRADERIPLLLETPAAVRFLSVEPLLEEVSFRWAKWEPLWNQPGGNPKGTKHLDGLRRLDWVIVGGESGPGARPCNVKWIRSIVEQCRKADVACFVKQLGAHYVDEENGVGGVLANPDLQLVPPIRKLRNRKGGDIEEFPEMLRVREFPR